MNEATIRANQRLLNEAWTHLSKTKKKSTELSAEGAKCTYGSSGCAFAPAVDIEKATQKNLLTTPANTLLKWPSRH